MSLKNKVDEALSKRLPGEIDFSDQELESLIKQWNKLVKEKGLEDEKVARICLICTINLIKRRDETNNEGLWNYVFRKLGLPDPDGREINAFRMFLFKTIIREGYPYIIYQEGYEQDRRAYISLLNLSIAPANNFYLLFSELLAFYYEDLRNYEEKETSSFLNLSDSKKYQLFQSFLESDGYSTLPNQFTLLEKNHRWLFFKLCDTALEEIGFRFSGKDSEAEDRYHNLIGLWWQERYEHTKLNMYQSFEELETFRSDLEFHEKYRLDRNSQEVLLTIKFPSISSKILQKTHINLKTGKNRAVTKCFGLEEVDFFDNEAVFRIPDQSAEMLRALEIEIAVGGKIIYSSGENLYRDFLIFDNNEEVRRTTVASGPYQAIIPSLEDLDYTEDLIEIAQEPGFKNLYQIDAQPGAKIVGQIKAIQFEEQISIRDTGFSIQKTSINGVTYTKSRRKYEVITKPFYITYYEDENTLKRFELIINKKAVPWEKVRTKKYSSFRRFYFSEILEKNPQITLKIRDLYFGKTVFKSNYIFIDGLEIKYFRPYYPYFPDLKTKEKLEDFALSGDVIVQLKGNRIFSQSFTMEDSEIICSLEDQVPALGGELVIYPPILKWKFDQEDTWKTPGPHIFDIDVWYDSIPSQTFVQISPDFPTGVKLEYPSGNKINLNSKKGGFELGEHIRKYNDKVSTRTVFLRIKGYQKAIPLLRIHYSEKFIKDPFTLTGYQMDWNPKGAIIGLKEKDKVSYLIQIIQDHMEVGRFQLSSDPCEYELDKKLPPGPYTIKVTARRKKGLSRNTLEIAQLTRDINLKK